MNEVFIIKSNYICNHDISLSHQIIYHIIITGMQLIMIFIPMLFRINHMEKLAWNQSWRLISTLPKLIVLYLFRIASNSHTLPKLNPSTF